MRNLISTFTAVLLVLSLAGQSRADDVVQLSDHVSLTTGPVNGVVIEKDNARNKDLKALKTELEKLHQEVKDTEYYFSHVEWLQERFPGAQYEDVTGLCKLATMEDIKEQDYSLNPGRYVGVVIEEDGKTEEEFIEEMLVMNEELKQLSGKACKLEKVINHNLVQITGEE